MSTLKHIRKKGAKKKEIKTRNIIIIILALAVLTLIFIILAYIFSSSDTEDSESSGLATVNITAFDSEFLTINGDLMSYDDTATGITSLQGIDVSAWQGDIDWDEVKSQGIDFVMIRLGYSGYETGNIVLDENYEVNITGALEAGLDVGVYFYSQAITEEEAKAEAEFVISNVEGYDITLPIVYDAEDYTGATARTDDLTGDEATANCISFCEYIEAAGYNTMIYTNYYRATEFYDMTLLADYAIWYADYSGTPMLTGGFAMWQYSAKGEISGISSTYVDMNLLFIQP